MTKRKPADAWAAKGNQRKTMEEQHAIEAAQLAFDIPQAPAFRELLSGCGDNP